MSTWAHLYGRVKNMQKLPKNVKVLGVVSFLNDASSDMVYPLIPIFLTKVLGASMPVVGLIEGVAESTASLMKVFSGWLSDKLKKRKGLTVLGYGLSAVAKPVLAFAASPWHVLFVRFADRFGKGIRQAPRDALIADSMDHGALGYAYGFHKAMDTLGATIGPILAVLLLPALNDDLRKLFLFSFVASFLAVITLAVFVREPEVKDNGAALPKLSVSVLPRQYKLFLAAVAVFALGNFSDAFLFLRAQDVGVSAFFIPLLYALSNLFFAGFAMPLGKLADRIGPHRIILGGYFVFALTHLGFAVFASTSVVWLLFPMFGIFSAMTESMNKTVTVQISDPQLRGTMLGMMHTTIGIVQLPASVIAGLLWQRGGASAPFLFAIACAAVASVILFTAFSQNGQKVFS